MHEVRRYFCIECLFINTVVLSSGKHNVSEIAHWEDAYIENVQTNYKKHNVAHIHDSCLCYHTTRSMHAHFFISFSSFIRTVQIGSLKLI